MKRARVLILFLVLTAALSSCAGLSMFGEEITRAFKGVPATMTTYTQDGAMVDRVSGTSFRVSRDKRFDTSNSDGTSKNDSSVLLISLGNNHISHVGSSMILAQDGLVDVSGSLPATVSLANNEHGVPFLNNIREKYQNLWRGKSKTIMIRSQDGTPIAIFAGNTVESFATDVPKSTAFRVDGLHLVVYRSDLTVYDNELLD